MHPELVDELFQVTYAQPLWSYISYVYFCHEVVPVSDPLTPVEHTSLKTSQKNSQLYLSFNLGRFSNTCSHFSYTLYSHCRQTTYWLIYHFLEFSAMI